MRLKVMLPSETLVNEDVTRVIAEAANGSFCLLPRHIDFVAALVPGLLSFSTSEGEELLCAINTGVLVKCGDEVLVSTDNAVRGRELGELRQMVQKQFRTLSEREKKALNAMNKIEAGLVRRFLEIQQLP